MKRFGNYEQEYLYGTQRNELISVRQDQKFGINPYISQLRRELRGTYESGAIDVTSFQVEGVGKGYIETVRMELADDADFPQDYPAGDVRPVTFGLHIMTVSPDLFQRVKVRLSYEGNKYFGVGQYDSIELESGLVNPHYMDWRRERSRIAYRVYFPPSEEVLRRVQFSVSVR